MKRVALYARVSSDEQAGPGHLSLEQQIAACRSLALERGYQVVMVEQDIQTGLDPKRPGYQRLKDAARRREIDLALVWKWDRWGRNPGESISTYDELLQMGIMVESIMEPGNDPFMQKIMAVLGWQGSRDTSQRVIANLRARAARGDWVNSKAPTGFRTVRVNDRPTLEIDPETAPYVRALFEDAATGQYSLNELLRRVYRRGGWIGGQSLSRSALHKILVNPAYCGTLVYGRISKSKFGARGKQPAESWITVENAHPALINRETWDAVQRWLREHQRRQGTVRHSPYLLTSLLWCGRCGHRLYGGTGVKKKGIAPGSYGSYACSHRALSQACNLPSTFAPKIEAWVKGNVIAAFRITDDDRAAAAALLEQEVATQSAGLAERRRLLEVSRRGHEEMRRTLARRVLAGVIAEDIYQELEAEEVLAVQTLDRALAELPETPPTLDLRRTLTELALLDWESLSFEEWRGVLVLLVDRITVDGPGQWRIEWQQEAAVVQRAVANVSRTAPHP